MSLFVASLNSGSNGNCYYLGNSDHAILIDAGISCRETVKRLKRLKLSIKNVRAIFVSHEHADHIYGVATLSKKFDLPVYISKKTQENGNICIHSKIHVFTAYEPVNIGGILVTAFPKIHDACDPHSFLIESSSVAVGIFTDIGITCEHVISNFKKCHAAFLESNYDEEMLERGRYPFPLKNRIRNGQGHLSNIQAADLFARYAPPHMTHLFLSHLSMENNRPALVLDLFKKIAGSTEIVIAPRSRETKLYHIRGTGTKNRISRCAEKLQLSLF